MATVPTLCLVGVVPSQLIARLKANPYEVIHINKIPRGIDFTEDGISHLKFGSRCEMDRYCRGGKTSSDAVFATNNVKNFRTYHLQGEVERGNHCNECNLVIEGEGGGFPVAVSEEIGPNGKMIPCFYCVGNFCDYLCAWEYVKNKKTRKSVQPMSTESWLKSMYRLTYGSELNSNLDFSLLKENGGCLTKEELKSKKYSYVKCPGFVTKPCKEVFQRF